MTWGPSVQVREEEEDGQRVKVIVSALVLVPSDKLDENTAAAIAAVSQRAEIHRIAENAPHWPDMNT